MLFTFMQRQYEENMMTLCDLMLITFMQRPFDVKFDDLMRRHAYYLHATSI